MKAQLHRLATRIFNTPLAIWRPKAEVILDVLADRLPGLAGVPVSVDASLLEVEEKESADYGITPDGIAIINICGTLVRKASGLHAWSGIASYERVEREWMGAVDDESVKAILVLCDSPGGEVGGLFDLCDKLAAHRGKKPTYAAVQEMACSAMYALAAVCDKIFMTQTAYVGSIGVFCMHCDQSRFDEKVGLKVTYIQAGAKKTDGNEHEPLSEAALADLQAHVDYSYGLFVRHVAKHRGIGEDAVRATEGGVPATPQEALALKLADAIGTPEDAIEALRAEITTKGKNSMAMKSSGSGAKARLLATNRKAEDPTDQNAEEDEPTSEEDETLPDQAEDTDEEEPFAEEEEEKPVARKPAGVASKASVIDVKQINALCKIAGRTDLLSMFLDKGFSTAKVQEHLQNLAAKESDSFQVNGKHDPVRAGMAKIDQIAASAAQIAGSSPGKTREQVYAALILQNPDAYTDYKFAHEAAAFRFRAGDRGAARF